jgi:DNA-binding response OmpR family regulator
LASNGSEAVLCAVELRPDLVLLDIDLNWESGFDIARRLHAELAGDTPPVILISTHIEEDYAELIGASPSSASCPRSRCQRTRSVRC